MSYGTFLQFNVAALLADHGYDLTFRRATRSTYDPATGQSANTGNADETVRGMFIAYRDRDIDGTLVQRGDRRAIIAPTYNGTAITKEPQVDDEIRGEGDPVRVVSARTIKSGASVAAYICQVRI